LSPRTRLTRSRRAQKWAGLFMEEYNFALQQADPHTGSITAIHTDLSNFTAEIITQDNIVLHIEYRPPHSWEVLQLSIAADHSKPLTSFESLHTLLGHFSRLYRQSFQAAVVAKLLEHTATAAATTETTTTPTTSPTPTTDTAPVVPTTATAATPTTDTAPVVPTTATAAAAAAATHT
jgi:hypothetical protein